MKHFIRTLTLSILLFSYQSESANRINLKIPNAVMESEQVWRTIQDISFFEENNYQLNLPQGPLIERLKKASREETLKPEDYTKLKAFIQDEIYNQEDYRRGYEKIHENTNLINKLVNEISRTQYPWHFKEFETYQVNLTLYGPGGSYNADEGSILILTTPEGQFKQYNNPTNTIIHEVTHIGVQQSIIDKHQVPHVLKEQIVDTFVFLHFNAELPNYKIQNLGDENLSRHLKTKRGLLNLEDIIEKMMAPKQKSGR